MPQRVVHLATSHHPGDPRIFQKECRTLASAGYEVVYIVPGDRDEFVDGVRIRVVPIPSSGKERMTRTVRNVYDRAMEEGQDAIMHIHDSDLILVGFRLKRDGRRVIYDAHEDTPRQMRSQHWIPAPLRPVASGLFAVLEHRAGQRFDGIITPVRSYATRFPAHKTITVHNYPLIDELNVSGSTPYNERSNYIAYVGALTRNRGLEQMIHVTRSIPKEYHAELVLGGSFHPTNLEAEVLDEGDSVRYLGYLRRPAVAGLLTQSRVGIAVIHPLRRYMDAYPTKMFEYMAAALPVVVSDFPSWRAIVDQAACGFVVNPLDVGAIAGKIRWLLDHPIEAEAMGERGRNAVRIKYNWSAEGRRLIGFYERLLAGQAPGEL